MALRIWCDPKYFPAEKQADAVAAATTLLAARGVTLEQARKAQRYADEVVDLPDEDHETPEHLSEWHDAWFDAILAAESAIGLTKRTAFGAMLVLDAADGRFFGSGPGSRLH
jgi:hypothetical protein